MLVQNGCVHYGLMWRAKSIKPTKTISTHMPSGFFDFDGLDGIVDTADSDLS